MDPLSSADLLSQASQQVADLLASAGVAFGADRSGSLFATFLDQNVTPQPPPAEPAPPPPAPAANATSNPSNSAADGQTDNNSASTDPANGAQADSGTSTSAGSNTSGPTDGLIKKTLDGRGYMWKLHHEIEAERKRADQGKTDTAATPVPQTPQNPCFTQAAVQPPPTQAASVSKEGTSDQANPNGTGAASVPSTPGPLAALLQASQLSGPAGDPSNVSNANNTNSNTPAAGDAQTNAALAAALAVAGVATPPTPSLAGQPAAASTSSNSANASAPTVLDQVQLLLMEIARLGASKLPLTQSAKTSAANPLSPALAFAGSNAGIEPASPSAGQTNSGLAAPAAAKTIPSNAGNETNSDPATNASTLSLGPATPAVAPDQGPKWGNPPANTAAAFNANADFLNFLSQFSPQATVTLNDPLFAAGAASPALPAAGTGNEDGNLDPQNAGAGTAGQEKNIPDLLPNAPAPLGAAPQPSNPYDFASQLSAARAARGGMTGLPSPLEQVVLQMNRGVKDGNSEMSIQLRPAELGRVDVKLNISSDGKVQGTVVADNQSTLNLLLKDVRSLERGLQEAGFSADPGSLQFSLRGDQQSGGSFNFANQSAFNAPTFSSGASSTTHFPVSAVSEAETYYLTPGRVNMRV